MRLKTDHIVAFAVTVAPVFYFLPALLNDLVLGPDDGVLFNIPIRVAAANLVLSGNLPLWNPYIFSGIPLWASAQGGLLFPLNWFYLIFSAGVATNLMVLSTYMIAAAGAYFYARRTGLSLLGAVITSLTWQFGSFMIGQISHINIVHTAAVLPWVLWSLDRYVENGSRARGAVLAVVIAIQIFAGHQQTFVYTALLVVAYTIAMAVFDGQLRKRYLRSVAFMAAGVLLGAVQILPTYELLRNSLRATATYDFFSSFSMPVAFVKTLLTPYIMGGGDGRIFRATYISQSYYTEYAVYAGILAVLLSFIAVILKPDKQTLFWIGVVIAGFLLAFGRNLPFDAYRLIYYVPVLNLFRVPARHLVEISFALAILAGRGATVLADARDQPKVKWHVATVVGIVFVLTVSLVTVFRPANFELFRQAPVSVLRAPELFMPIVLAALSAAVLWCFVRKKRGSSVLLLTVLIFDLAMWGQFSGWYTSIRRIPSAYFGVPESVAILRERAADLSNYRILTSHKTFDPESSSHTNGWLMWTEPNVYSMFGISNAAGYDGFGLDRYSQLAGRMKLWGALDDPNATLRSASREIDLLNVRYLIARTDSPEKDADSSGSEVGSSPQSAFPAATQQIDSFKFAANDLGLPRIGLNKRMKFVVPPVEVDRIAFVTNLSWADALPDNTVIATLRLKGKDQRVFEFQMRAGIETADWAYDRPDIRRRVRHKRPTVATSYDVSDAQFKYKGQTYVASVSLPEKLQIESGELIHEPQSGAPDMFLSVFRISLVDAGGEKFYPLAREMITVEGSSTSSDVTRGSANQKPRWTLFAEGKHFDVYENSLVLPRAWLAIQSQGLADAAALQTIQTGVVPDGSKWDPLRTALVQAKPSLDLTATSGTAQVVSHNASRIDVRTQTNGNSILVLSENYYPGWKAYIDDKSVDVLRVNFGLRGVVVPAGEHRVSFVYRPWSVLAGLMISVGTAAVLLVLAMKGRRRIIDV